ncbi:MAG TPA: methyltransferase domain-containing protein [Thermoanaerobaculia bacterium]|nr:methyltransferase domain-containing protein [Thermoanaerobaculia bacterium]
MHRSARRHCKLFFRTYLKDVKRPTIVEIGSQSVNGSLRDVAPPDSRYVGLDFVPGEGVDLVLDDPYRFRIEDDFADAVVSSSCLEHSQMFWLTFLEALRILKPEGVLYLNVPSNGPFHRHPTDNWRFYPDAGAALNEWAHRSGYDSVLLESFVGWQDGDVWNDFVAVFAKTRSAAVRYPDRIHPKALNPTNVIVDGNDEPINYVQQPQDRRRLNYLTERFFGLRKKLDEV